MSYNKELWNECIKFHGHECGGIAIGFQAANYARELLEIDFSDNENTVAVCENDTCAVDAIQVILGCSIGKGNLLLHICGKMAFNFYNRETGKSVRLVLRPKPEGAAKGKEYYLNTDYHDLFDVKETKIMLPETARSFESIKCDECGEMTADYMIRLAGGRKLCTDCFKPYERFK